MTTIWIVLLWGGLVIWKGKIITYSLLSLLVTKPIEVNGGVAIDLCGLSSGPVYATANWRGKSSAVKGKRSKREGVKNRERIEPFVY